MKDDFDKIGKKMPYRVPENFFADMEQEIIRDCTPEKQAPVTRRFSWLKIAVAAAVLIAVSIPAVWFASAPDSSTGSTIAFNEDSLYAQTEGKSLYAESKADKAAAAYESNIDDYIENLPEEELDAWVDFYESDIFLIME